MKLLFDIFAANRFHIEDSPIFTFWFDGLRTSEDAQEAFFDPTHHDILSTPDWSRFL